MPRSLHFRPRASNHGNLRLLDPDEGLEETPAAPLQRKAASLGPKMPVRPRSQRAPRPDDGTRQLLQWGGSIVAAGVLAAILLQTLLGGYSRTGATTNAGWFALIVALMCIPFGGMLLALGLAKWLRNRRIARGDEER
jgi:hypothetical protein